ncbi:hypothetical protein AHF37_06014 [Paragonimus kellicotti]|nr:hypothetical protein AHF37_06014 [Paragonimus kellicotti]
MQASPNKQTSNGSTPTNSPHLADRSGPITCEVTAGHVSPLPAQATYKEQRVERVKIKSDVTVECSSLYVSHASDLLPAAPTARSAILLPFAQVLCNLDGLLTTTSLEFSSLFVATP